MAVQEQTPYIEHIANGVTTSFSLEFECKDKEHLIVLVDNVEPNVGTWSLVNGAVVFGIAPADGKIISIQRNTPFRRDTNFQSYDNSLRPATINKDFDWIWYKLQELGVADWILGSRIDALKNYVDDRDDELRAYLMEEIRKQGVALDQLDDYYNYLMQRLAQIAVDKGWDSSFVVDASGETQQQVNYNGGSKWHSRVGGYLKNERVVLANDDIVKSAVDGNTINPNSDMTGWLLVNSDGQIKTWSGRTQEQKNKERITPLDHDAKGDGITNDSLAFANIETSINAQVIDLCGKTYLVGPSVPIGNTYVNGFFKISTGTDTGQTYHADDSDAVLSDATDTGAAGTPYSGGLILNQYTSAGRSTRNRRALIASQNCRSSYQMCVNIGSIYSWAKGNVAGNYSSRQSIAAAPQAVNIGTEEGGVWGFAGINAGAQFSIADGSRCGNFIARYCNAGGTRLAANFASHYSNAGGGAGLRTKVNVSGGSVESIEILDGGKNYTTGHNIVVQDMQTSNDSNAVVDFTLDATGKVTAINIVNAGTGLSNTAEHTVRLMYPSSSGAECAANYSSYKGEAHAMYSSNISSYEVSNYGFASSIIASRNSKNYAKYGFIAGSDVCNVLDTALNNTAIIGSTGVNLTAGRTAAIASNGADLSGAGSISLAGYTVNATHTNTIIAGRRVSSFADRTMVFGDAISGSASTANRKVQIGIASGNIAASGTITGSSPFADYAEYFENAVKGEIPLGVLVALDGDKVKVANEADNVIGVVSGTAFIVGNGSEFTWNGRYLYGEFGEPIYHDVNCVRWSEYDGLVSEAIDIPEDAEYYTQTVQQENPDYNPSLENIPRSQRKDDWSCVGLMGQVYVRIGSDINIGDYLVAVNGIGVPSSEKTNLKIMKITKEFDGEYGIAVCLLK